MKLTLWDTFCVKLLKSKTVQTLLDVAVTRAPADRGSVTHRRVITTRSYRLSATSADSRLSASAAMSRLAIASVATYNKKAVLSQGNRAMPQLFFSI